MMLAKKLDPESYPYDEDEAAAEEGAGQNKDRTAVLAIAYHNMGVEQEFLKSYPAAILSYKKAVNFAEKHLGADDGITQNLRNVYENAKIELDQSLYKKGARKGATKGPKQKGNMADQYDNMMTPRNDNNMERVDEEGEDQQVMQD